MNHPIHPALAAIITPGTDQDVVDRYATLAERAKTYDFGLLEDDVVIIDTETTGLDFKSCELIEVAAARLRGREIVDTMDLFVRPSSPIPSEIVAITGITDEMVADADDAVKVTKAFREFAGDTPLIAHNAAFDRHFMEKGNRGKPVGPFWIDSLELSRIVLPCLSSHKLHDLSRAFDLHQSTHRAIDDVVATCGLWRILLTAASDLPAGLLNELANFYPKVAWTYRPIFAQMAAANPNAPFSLVDERAERCAKAELAARPDAFALAENGPMNLPSPDRVADEFKKEGAVGRMYKDYEPRTEQVEMARAVAQAFKSNGFAAVEAGTGVGKSIAYLLPSALLAQTNNITVGVATKSNALTDQLINRELPLLSAALDKPLSYMALKGYDNYPCLRKVDRLIRLGMLKDAPVEESQDGENEKPKAPVANEDLLNALAAIMAYGVQSAYGDVNCLGIRWGKVQRSDVTSAAVECQKRRCPYFPNRCFLHLARRRAAACDVVVTNHSLLFRQVGSDIEVLPPVRYWIVDEAHSAEAEARRQWAKRVNSREVGAAFELMGGTSSGAVGTLLKEVRTKPSATLMMGLLTKVASECARASIASGLFFDDLKTFCKKRSRGRGSSYESEAIWIDAEARVSAEFAQVAESGRAFADVLEKVVGCAREVTVAVAEPASGDAGLLDRLNEFNAAAGELANILEALQLSVEGDDQQYVFSAAYTQRTGFEAYELVAERIDVGGQLAQRWYPETSSVVYSSATIAVGEKFDHFAHEVGLDRMQAGSVKSLRLDSSYDFDCNMSIVVANDLPDPTKQKDDYLAALAPLLAEVHLAMGGSTLTLFTNRAEMDRMYELVQPILAQHGLELAAQSRGSNVRRLRDHFIEEKSSSLFALKSFWEGFDAQGDTLRCVVIPRLPFTPPSDPLSQERKMREGRDAWKNHDLPESVLAMKQAVGRLIRSSNDKGALVLADPRLTGMWYGRVFLSSLPKKDYTVMGRRDVGSFLRQWNANNAVD